MAHETLHDLYVDELKDLYSAENQIIKALPQMIQAASSPELHQALEHHLQVTRGQVDRLDQIFRNLGEQPHGKKCVGMEGLIKEGEELINHKVDPDVMDAGIIGAAQKVEHYEITAYGTARAHARELGYHDAAGLLQQTLDEEGDADKLLTRIAETRVNKEASEEDTREKEMATASSAWR